MSLLHMKNLKTGSSFSQDIQAVLEKKLENMVKIHWESLESTNLKKLNN